MNQRPNAELPRLCALVCLWLCGACEAEPATHDAAISVDAALADADSEDDDADVPESQLCEEVEDGVPCAEDRHCIAERCVFKTCGDGVRDGDEACDDGNEALGDECDPACRVIPRECGDGIQQEGEECDDGNRFDLDACSVACTNNVCGNARLDGLEECDDGNLIHDDDCSDTCTENRCRNGRLDPGEQCDDGNRIHDDGCTNACERVECGNGEQEVYEECDDGNGTDDDACSNQCLENACGNRRVDPGELCDGDTLEIACSDDCLALEDDTCRPCEDQLTTCNDFEGSGIDLVAGCLDGAPPTDLVPIVDPEFAQDCIDAVVCSRLNQCVKVVGGQAEAVECYCGEQGTDACQMDGPLLDAKCVPEWTAATRGTTNAQILDLIPDLGRPSGWAFYLLRCDQAYCAEECAQ